MHNRKDQLQQLLTPLCILMRLSREAYSKYLVNKIYLHAETIRLANKRIYKLLLNKAAFIPADLEHDIVILLNHYDAWFTQFRDHKKKLQPSPGDEFVFYPVDDQSPFPKQSEERIFRYTDTLKSEFASKD
jgi:hypothetical protein